MPYRSDLYIFLPCIVNGSFSSEDKASENMDMFINEMSATSEYEFDKVMNKSLKRYRMGEITLMCWSDGPDSVSMGEQKAFITASLFDRTDLCLMIIAVPEVEVSLTHLLDQASRGELTVKDNEKEMLLSEMIERFGLKITGKAFCASCVSEFPKNEAGDIIAGEVHDESLSAHTDAKEIFALFGENRMQYYHHDAYLSPFGVMYIVNDFVDDYAYRLKIECLLIFIMELVILKITAINAVKEDVVTALMEEKPSMEEVLKISEKFSKSMPLWDTNRFRYHVAQIFADRVASSFRVPEYVEEYEKNQRFLEHMIRIKSLITSEKSIVSSEMGRRALSLLVTVLAVLQFVPLLYSVIHHFVQGNGVSIEEIISLFFSATLIVVLVYLLFGKGMLLRKEQ